MSYGRGVVILWNVFSLVNRYMDSFTGKELFLHEKGRMLAAGFAVAAGKRFGDHLDGPGMARLAADCF